MNKDHEDDPPNELPPTLPPGSFEPVEAFDTYRPPPPNFEKMSDSEKIHWLCNTVYHLMDQTVSMNQRLSVLEETVGKKTDPSAPTICAELERQGVAVVHLATDLEAFREHFLGEGASVRELKSAQSRLNNPSASDDPSR